MITWAVHLGAFVAVMVGTQITEKALGVSAGDDGLLVFLIVVFAVAMGVFIAVQLVAAVLMAIVEIARG